MRIKIRMVLICLLVGLLFSYAASAQNEGDNIINWSSEKEIPNDLGYNGSFIGVHNDALIIAGGANFPGQSVWDGGQKVWSDVVYVLAENGNWNTQKVKLSRPLAYGLAINTTNGVLCIGGSNSEGIYNEVFLLKWNKNTHKIEVENLPPLPTPLAYMGGDRIGDFVYVVGGQVEADGAATTSFLSLNMRMDSYQWKVLNNFHGKPRNHPVVVAQSNGHEDCLYVFSGTNYNPKAFVTHEMLYDVYEYHPYKNEWKEKGQIPSNNTPDVKGGFIGAAPSLKIGDSHIMVFGGAGGENQPLFKRLQIVREINQLENLGESTNEVKAKIDLLKSEEKKLIQETSFSKTIWAYHTITDTWRKAGELSSGSQVVTKALKWNDNIIIPGGEIRPGVRTSTVLKGSLKPHQVDFGMANYITLVAYLVIMIFVGWYFSRKNKTTNDFFLAGGRIPWWAAGLSIYATMLSAITYLSQTALSYSFDWQVYLGYFAILLVTPVVIVFYLPFFRKLNITTAYEYLEKRFNVVVRMFGSTSFVLFQLVRMGIVVYLPALALSTVVGINIYMAISIMGVLAILYTYMGGMEAVIWTDVIQVIVLIGGLVVGLVYIALEGGGVSYIFKTAYADGKLQMVDWRFSFTEVVTWSLFLGSFALTLVPYTTDQAVVQRYMTTSSEKESKKSIWLNAIISIPAGLLIFTMGTFLYVYFKEHPEFLNVAMQNDSVFPLFIANHLPSGVAGLIIAGIFSASMSSLDSSMHSVSTVITVDYFKRFSTTYSEENGFKIARYTTIVVGVFGTLVACLMAAFPVKSLFFLFQEVIGLLGSAMAGVFILGIFVKKSNWIGALLGALSCILVLVFVKYNTSINFYIYPLIAIPVCVVGGTLFSVIIPVKSKDIQGLYFTKRSD